MPAQLDPLPAPHGVDACPDCAAPLGGRDGCAETFHAMTLRASTSARLGATHRAVHDAFCLQHPGSYSLSVKSFMAHFRSLQVAMELGSDARTMERIWADLTLPPDARKIPPARAMALTIADVAAARTVDEHERVVARYLDDVWGAWAPHHALARAWTRFGVERRRGGR